MENRWLGSRLMNRTAALLERSLDLRNKRHQLLASNVANSETADFAPRDIPFSRVLEGALQDGGALPLARTHPGHLPAGAAGDGEVETGPAGVDIDREMAKLAENNLRYQADVQALTKKLEGLKYVLESNK